MIVTLISQTPDAEKVCAAAAWNCTHQQLRNPASFKYEEAADLVARVLKRRHTSIAEHASYTFAIEGISRACSHQLVRNRIASYAQQSQRYVEGWPTCVIPESIAKNLPAYYEFTAACTRVESAYKNMLSLGIPPEDARFIMPNAAQSNIVVTMNARQLVLFFQQRLCKRAQWEIREMAEAMRELLDGPLFMNAIPQCDICTDHCTE